MGFSSAVKTATIDGDVSLDDILALINSRKEVEDVNKAHEAKIDGIIDDAEGGGKPSALERLKNSEGGSQ